MSVGLVMRVLRILQPELALPRVSSHPSVPPRSFPQGKFGNLQKMNEIAAFREMV